VNFERTIASRWHRSQRDTYDVFQAGPGKAHVAGLYSRYSVNGERIRRTVITYIVTKHVTADGDHWGIQARFAAGAADLDEAERGLAGIAALAAVDAYFEALSDPTNLAGWASTLNYPHVRIANGQVEQWDTADDYMDGLQGGRQLAPARLSRAGASWHKLAAEVSMSPYATVDSTRWATRSPAMKRSIW
jgi:hypothetical protein